MAILRSSDGRFYDIEDDQLESRLIPAEQIKEKLGAVGVGPSPGPVGPAPQMVVPGSGGQVVIQIYTSPESQGAYEGGPDEPGGEGEVEAHGWCWRRNHFCNHWRRNCWRNHCHHPHW